MIRGDSDSTDSSYSDELQDQINYNQDKLKCEECFWKCYADLQKVRKSIYRSLGFLIENNFIYL